MTLTRKLILPAAIMFTAFLVGLFVYFTFNLQEAVTETEENNLATITNSFFVETENQERLALALAITAADNPAIQESFANRDREELSKLVLPGYSMLQSAGENVIQNGYYLPDGTLFFSANDTAATETAASPAVLLAGSQQKPVAGLDVQDGALVIRGISPIFYQNRHIGSVEFQIGLNAAMLQGMQNKYKAEWRILLSKDLVGSRTLTEPGPIEELLVVTRTEGATIFSDPTSYTSAQKGESVITHPSKDGRAYGLQSSAIFDYSGRIIGVLDVLYDHTDISTSQNTRLFFAGLASVVVLTLGLMALSLLIRRTLQPIQLLTRAASEISEGNQPSFVRIAPRNDEIGILTEAFNRMTNQLRSSITHLEERVQGRTHDLEDQSRRLRVAAEISQSSTSLKRLDEVLERSAQLILDRFHYYHVGIYTIDHETKVAALVASPTNAGKQMINDRYRVRVGDATAVGRVAATGAPRVVSGTSADARFAASQSLPETRSELALPLKVEDRVIGVLDIHSSQDQAFTPEDVSVMLVLADQLASAIERTRLLEESTNALNELERTSGRFTSSGWKRLAEGGRLRNPGYRFDNIRIEPLTHLTETSQEALVSGNRVVKDKDEARQEVAIPIKFRGQTIGVVHAKLQPGSGEKVISTLELAVDRLASSLESARLYEEARTRADREQTIAQITNAISASSDYESILRTTVREIGHALTETEVGIQILGDATQNPLEEGRN